ncbi:uncharacterized protein LOC118749490 [Rhagoletis pomonella]|uniref:uncharacterized protein LOC118749490 n=1 Tax=Rhagoletis pomonella TaxID=28610 RepID=UPI00177C33DF|nr:uncharacterized protein LOC118749490 [Rhagoletis pomonella]
MNDPQQPVRNRSETAVENSASGSEIHRIEASLRQVKTQSAKISYTSSLKTSRKEHTKKDASQRQQLEGNSTDPEFKQNNVTDRTRGVFGKKKEREKEFTDLKLYLKEIANNKIVDSCNEKDADSKTLSTKSAKVRRPTFRRCKTEILGTKPGSQTERHLKTGICVKPRSKSSQPSETKSHELLTPGRTKRKSYNVEAARKFIDDRRLRRRSQAASSIKFNNEKNAFEKEQIKKRLEDLHKNSRAIIAKNVKRKKLPLGNKNIIKSNQKSATDPCRSNENKCDRILIHANVKMANEYKETSKNFACDDDPSTKDKTVNLGFPLICLNIHSLSVSVLPCICPAVLILTTITITIHQLRISADARLIATIHFGAAYVVIN